MAQFNQITKTLTLDASGGANDKLRVWDTQTSCPVDIVIYLSTKGEVTAAGNLVWTVLYGGKWDGTPYAEGSTHTGGVSQGTGTIAGSAEVLEQIHSDVAIPINSPSAPGFPNNTGFPVVVQLENSKAVPVTVDIIFMSKTLNTNV